MLTDTALKNLKPKQKTYKVTDRDGMYAEVKTTGRIVFRFDYRLHGRRETLTLGRYGRDGISLAEARDLCMTARKAVKDGQSPAQEKQREKRRLNDAESFGEFAQAYFQESKMADSTRAMRKHVYDRDIAPSWTKRLLHEVTPEDLRNLCGRVKDRGAPAGGVPASILEAPSGYAGGDLPLGQIDAAADDALGANGLTPPEDPMWGERAMAQAGPPPIDHASAGAVTERRADPQDVARSAPIMFAADRAEAREDDDGHLNARLIPPRSRYEIQSGSVIPAALVTALNSDLPGRVIAQVTAPVYDSVSGDHLLIPQGARLVGAYESGTRYGDHRITLVWNRLILPNGWSINLREMNATDAEGTSGLSDRTDNHLDRLGVAIGLSAVVSVVANESEDDTERGSITQSVGDAAAQQAAQTGGRIVARELTVRPTLRVRAGAPVRVLVTRDIQLRPYAGAR